MGWLATPGRVLKPSRIRLAFLFVGAVAFAITETGRFVLRPYVREHGINDIGLTDCIGNLGGIVVQVFLGLSFFNPTKPQSYRLAGFFALGYILYEFAQPVLPRGVFDWKDIYGTAIGFCLSLPVLALLWRLYPVTKAEQAMGGHSNGRTA